MRFPENAPLPLPLPSLALEATDKELQDIQTAADTAKAFADSLRSGVDLQRNAPVLRKPDQQQPLRRSQLWESLDADEWQAVVGRQKTAMGEFMVALAKRPDLAKQIAPELREWIDAMKLMERSASIMKTARGAGMSDTEAAEVAGRAHEDMYESFDISHPGSFADSLR